MANNSGKEPDTAPQPGRWYDLTLGPSFSHDSSNKYCTLRYEFKPASIDKTKPGSMLKNKDNRVTVEFQNNQLGKPKVSFEGSSEDYKDNDAVLFFDGNMFRLERLHRAVKQLRHKRQPGESAAALAAVDPRLSPPVGKGAKPMQVAKSSVPPVPVEVERIDIGEPENLGMKASRKGVAEYPSELPHASSSSAVPKDDEVQENQDAFSLQEIFGADFDDERTDEPAGDIVMETNVQQQHDTDEEIADVDDSGDEAGKGLNAAEALRAQVNAGKRDRETSSSSSSSESGDSSSSSDNEESDEDSITSV